MLEGSARRPGEQPKEYLERLRHRDPALQAEYDRLGPQWEAITALVKARLEAGLTQGELAERMGVSRPVVVRLESAEHAPRVDTLAKAARAMGLELEVAFRKPKKKRPSSAA